LVDINLIEQKLKELDRYLVQLAKHRGATAEDLKTDLDKAWIVEHGLQLCIQAVLDMGNHILAEKGLTVTEYADIFDELARLEVLPKDFAQKISGMAGFRNILVLEYAKVDLEQVAKVLNNNLNDFREFAKHLGEFLQLR